MLAEHRVFQLVLALALPLAGATTACVLDWTLRDDGAPGDAAPADGGAHDAADGASVDAADAAESAPIDAPSCATLLGAVADARAEARACTLGVGDCAAKVTDECGCGVFVARASSGAAASYGAAVAAAKSAGCTGGCAGSCPFVPAIGACLQSPTGIACSP